MIMIAPPVMEAEIYRNRRNLGDSAVIITGALLCTQFFYALRGDGASRADRSEIRNPKSEVRGPRSEVRGPKSEVRNPRSECTEGRRIAPGAPLARTTIFEFPPHPGPTAVESRI